MHIDWGCGYAQSFLIFFKREIANGTRQNLGQRLSLGSLIIIITIFKNDGIWRILWHFFT